MDFHDIILAVCTAILAALVIILGIAVFAAVGWIG
jgi:hypothetical protein